MRGAFFELVSVGYVHFLRCLCAPGASRFCRSVSEHLKLKKSNSEWKSAQRHLRFFFSLSNQLMERGVFCFGDESLTESSETVMMEENIFVCRGLPGAVFFKISANITVYLTEKNNISEPSHYNPLIRLTD